MRRRNLPEVRHCDAGQLAMADAPNAIQQQVKCPACMGSTFFAYILSGKPALCCCNCGNLAPLELAAPKAGA